MSTWLSRVLSTAVLVSLPLHAEAEAKRYEPFFAFAFNPEFTLQGDALERGMAKAYLTDDFSVYRRYTPENTPDELKQAIWNEATDNPFSKAYADIYEESTAEKLQQCAYWGQVAVDLDDNRNTGEWLIAVSKVLCMPDQFQHNFRFDEISRDRVAHIWLLQKSEDQYRVLVEGDGGMIVNNKPGNNSYREVISQLKDQPLADSVYGCGETELRWLYRNDRYELNESISKASGCGQAYNYGEYEQFNDKDMDKAAARSASIEIADNDEKHLLEIRQKAQEFVNKLGFGDLPQTASVENAETENTETETAEPQLQQAASEPEPPEPSKPEPTKTTESKPEPEPEPVRIVSPRTAPANNLDLEKLIKSGALDELLKP